MCHEPKALLKCTVAEALEYILNAGATVTQTREISTMPISSTGHRLVTEVKVTASHQMIGLHCGPMEHGHSVAEPERISVWYSWIPQQVGTPTTVL